MCVIITFFTDPTLITTNGGNTANMHKHWPHSMQINYMNVMFFTCCLEMVVTLKWAIENPLRIDKRIKKESIQVLFNPMPDNSHLFQVKQPFPYLLYIFYFFKLHSYCHFLTNRFLYYNPFRCPTATSSIL